MTPRARLDPSDTIAAWSSASGPGARAIVRLTGPRAWEIALAATVDPPDERRPGRWPVLVRLPLARSPDRAAVADASACSSAFRRMQEPAQAGTANTLAADLLAWTAPHSYSGQDLVEFHLLSSPPLVEGLLGVLYGSGARPAQPGEFTLRAFLAGKLDLTQAEAVAEIVDADEPLQLKHALEQLAGGLSRPLHDLRRELLDLLAEVEAGLDFAEENLTFVAPQELQARIAAAGVQVQDLLDRLRQRDVSGRPFQVVLAGPPNAGKSSLFNALLGVDAALVSSAAGTTRDYLAARVCWEGVELELVDTAGWAGGDGGAQIAEVADAIIAEQANAARKQRIIDADLVLVCRDLSQSIAAAPSSAEAELQAVPQDRLLEIRTKCDLPGPTASLPATSARTGEGLAALKRQLVLRVQRSGRSASGTARGGEASAARCRRHLLEAQHALDAARDGLLCRQPMELIALDLRLAAEEIGMMAGEVYTEELLDRVFGKFCIGK